MQTKRESKCSERVSIPQPLAHKTKALPTAPPERTNLSPCSGQRLYIYALKALVPFDSTSLGNDI